MKTVFKQWNLKRNHTKPHDTNFFYKKALVNILFIKNVVSCGFRVVSCSFVWDFIVPIWFRVQFRVVRVYITLNNQHCINVKIYIYYKWQPRVHLKIQVGQSICHKAVCSFVHAQVFAEIIHTLSTVPTSFRFPLRQCFGTFQHM